MNVALVDSLSKKYGPPTHHTSGDRVDGWKRRPVTGSRTEPVHSAGVFMNRSSVLSLEKR